MKIVKPLDLKRSDKIPIDTKSLYFNSRDTFCKSPFGSVPKETEVTLRFVSRKNDLSSVNLVISKHEAVETCGLEKYNEFQTIPMDKESTNDGKDYWEVTFKLDEIGVYGYHFELYKNENNSLIYGNNRNKINVPFVHVNGTGGEGQISQPGEDKLPYKLTVYSTDFQMPSWTDKMVIYYIFPDRFKNGNKELNPTVGKTKFYGNKDIEFHTNWGDPFPYVPGKDGSDKHHCNDFYGGDLEGIIQKLDYIKSLGVNLIYINPIFQAASNHKYDTADYLTIDPHFGDIDTFRKLVAEADKRNMHIVLDTSLNHSGADSLYMDRYGKYNSHGAFENEIIRKESPYYDWYDFNEKETSPDKMYRQWANSSLAELNESDSFKDFAFREKDSVMKYWLSHGISGWRMDVAPWVSDEFWREWRKEIKKAYPDAFTVGEIWFDSSKYLVGDMFDSVMNYIFRQAVLEFASGENAEHVMDKLEMLRENYPKVAFYRLMNLISSHDLPRAIWELGYKNYGDQNYEEIKNKFLLAVAFQFTYPGAPTIYYGDEIGMTGGEDPYNRGPYPWEEDGCNYGDMQLIEKFKTFGEMRNKHPVFATGEIRTIYNNEHIIAFERWNDKERAIAMFNNGNENVSFSIKGITPGDYHIMEQGYSIPLKEKAAFTLKATSYLILIKE